MGSVALGRPTDYDPMILPLVSEIAKSGATMRELAERIRVEVSTLYKWKHKYPAFAEALKVHRDFADDRIVDTLYSKATEGDNTAMIFWLKNRRPQEWRESRDQGSSVALTVSGPAAERLLSQLTQSIQPSPINPPTIDCKLNDNGDK